MRKNISVTNERVLEAMNQSENASKLIEVAILRYLEEIDKGYITRDELEEELEKLNKKVCILNENYTQSKELVINIAKHLKLI